MERKELFAALKRVAPALSSKDFIPIFSCFCFDGETVTAYDDIVALQAPMAFGIQGGIRGKLLLEFLNTSRSKEVLFEEVSPTEILVKAGRSRLKLPRIPAKDFIFSMPAISGDSFTPSDAFVQALEAASISMGMDPSHPWRLGVTASFGIDEVIFYSTDNISATRAFAPMKWNSEGAAGVEVILPPRFVLLLSALLKREGAFNTEVCVTDQWVSVAFESGLRLFSKTMQGPEVSQYESVLNSHIADDAAYLPLPRGIHQALDRALAVLSSQSEKVARFVVKDEVLLLHTRSNIGEIKDVFPVPTAGNVASTLSVDYFKRVLDLSDEFRIQKECLIVRNAFMDHLICASVE